MSGYDQLSRAAYRAVDLEANERLVMAHIEQHFPGAFTRAELAKSMGWAINRITGRIVSLRDKGLLTEDKARTVKCKVTHGDAHPLKNAAGRESAGMTSKPTDGCLSRISAPALAAPYTTPPSPSNESADVFNRLVAVVPESAAGQVDRVLATTAHRSSAPAAPHNDFSTEDSHDKTKRQCDGEHSIAGRANGEGEADSKVGSRNSDPSVLRSFGDTFSDNERRGLVAIVPFTGLAEQISIETAKRILKDPKNPFFKRAEAVLKGLPCNT